MEPIALLKYLWKKNKKNKTIPAKNGDAGVELIDFYTKRSQFRGSDEESGVMISIRWLWSISVHLWTVERVPLQKKTKTKKPSRKKPNNL